VPARPGITVTEGSAADPVAVASVAAEADAVLSALGPRGAKTPALLATAASNMVAAMERTGGRRLNTAPQARCSASEPAQAGSQRGVFPGADVTRQGAP
jgi:NAD(P)H-binding